MRYHTPTFYVWLGLLAGFVAWLVAMDAAYGASIEVETPEIDQRLDDLESRMQAEESEAPVDLGPLQERVQQLESRIEVLEAGEPATEPEPQSWKTDSDDGTYTLHTIGYGDVQITSDYEAHIGDCADCVPLDLALSESPSEGGILHIHGGRYEAGLPSLGKHTTIIGHDQPVFAPGSQWGGGPAADGWLVVSGVKMQDTTIWSKGDPAPRGVFVVDSELDGHAEGAIFTSQGCGLLEVWNTEIYGGGQGNVRHNVYSHCDTTVGKNVYSHSPNGSHAWKTVSDKQILRDSYITNVTKETIAKYEPLTRRIAEYFRWGTEKYEGLRPDQDGGPTGEWATRPDWSIEDWRQLASDFRHVWQQGAVGTTPVDMISCADSEISDTTIGFLRVPAGWMSGGYAESGKYALEFKHRRTEIGGCDDPGWWEPEFYEPETWQIGDVTDPQNENLKRHFVDADIQVVGPRRDQVTYVTNRGTQPIDRGGSGGTRENVDYKPIPPYWVEKSRVWTAREYPRVLETQTETCAEPCTTTAEERKAAIYTQ